MEGVQQEGSPRHYPVLLKESLEYLAIRPDGIYVDMTAGLGGHARAIAERLQSGLVIACDRDAESLELARANTAALPERIRFFHGPFSELPKALAGDGIDAVDGVLADLGVSRYQLSERRTRIFAESGRPFGYADGSQPGLTAADLVNELPEKALADLIFSSAKKGGREESPEQSFAHGRFLTTGRLAEVVERAVPRTGRIHPATQTFMALRLKVNEELEELENCCRMAPERLKPGGRFVVLTFMSTEDRIVKRAFQSQGAKGESEDPDEACCQAERARDFGKCSVTQREAAGSSNGFKKRIRDNHGNICNFRESFRRRQGAGRSLTPASGRGRNRRAYARSRTRMFISL